MNCTRTIFPATLQVVVNHVSACVRHKREREGGRSGAHEYVCGTRVRVPVCVCSAEVK